MAESRRRRIVRRVARIVVYFVLLVAAYVGSVATIIIATQAGWVPIALTASGVPRTYAAPILWCSAHSELPGSTLCRMLVEWSYSTGRRIGSRPQGSPPMMRRTTPSPTSAVGSERPGRYG